MTDLPPPVTSDVTLDDVEAFLDRRHARRKADRVIAAWKASLKTPLSKTAADRGGEGDSDREEQ